jgi:hypothetical protein
LNSFDEIQDFKDIKCKEFRENLDFMYKPSAHTLNQERDDQLNVLDARDQEYFPHAMLSFTVKNRDKITSRLTESALHKISKFSVITKGPHLKMLGRLLKICLIPLQITLRCPAFG